MDLTFAVAGVALGILVGAAIWQTIITSRGRSLAALKSQAESEAVTIRQQAVDMAAELRDRAAAEVATLRQQELASGRSDANALRDEARQLREEVTRELAQRRSDVEKLERRHVEREAQLGGREDRLRSDERELTRLRESLLTQQAGVAERQAQVDMEAASVSSQLEKVAGLSREEAAQMVRQSVEDEARASAAAMARDIRDRAQLDADKEARRIIAMASQRLASEHTAESTVATVHLPNDEMKGRIIGREGRNIRAFELATGVDVIIDDTPDTVVVSCFDPIRREVARRALEALVGDGRIHPGRIEELVAKARVDLDAQLIELGERAAYEVDVHGLHPELIRLVGRMRYRTSYGQNLYEHSKEVSWLAGMMAAELHCDVKLARRGGLLHDIGKVLTHDHEGTHVQLGVDVCRRHGESEAVLNAIEAHHNDVPHLSTESVLVQAADGISGSRPGARREAFDSYMKRLVKLEEIAATYPGVERSTVIQAGREIRVIVRPEQIGDEEARTLSEAIARRIENELQYPGQIRVTVIRETRATEVAR